MRLFLVLAVIATFCCLHVVKSVGASPAEGVNADSNVNAANSLDDLADLGDEHGNEGDRNARQWGYGGRRRWGGGWGGGYGGYGGGWGGGYRRGWGGGWGGGYRRGYWG
ncbi:glycine-rich RNA-binding, abscisic acid-inducible protein-like [Teleopsis dalmanni]|uniref:glycine-rich RNA-binding, abscisic acid-inducible protein-like n=1 Tax=Teleopsis dalmanni TaxID=139649 RepID=UPI0018CF7226|nr:glycine-rich RNA-binding, abscisic acid-inducible protein-like [Teleopsis dalmanni]